MAHPARCGHARVAGWRVKGFDHISNWVFDLDNTLYPESCKLFDQIAVRMTDFIVTLLGVTPDAASKLRHHYYMTYGTTLRGLMVEHGLEPHGFLNYVHEIDYSAVRHHESLGEALRALPGRKLIFTAGTRPHANNVLANLGCADVFEEIFDITDCHFIPKPDAKPYEIFLAQHKVEATQAAFFEDISANLIVPRSLGMTTVLVGKHDAALLPAHVDYVTDDLAHFLERAII
ncbi:MAG: pyrimidine 5'-nucleotidase [Alphaproteobacteria bacterium]|nr:pyrimidine 5'-nucleotidase [Alphaproteobacteria bacterium]